MDDRLQKIQLNNPIPLHFYSPKDRLPDDYGWKIVIVKAYAKTIVKAYAKTIDFRIASYSNKYDEWDDDHMYHIDNDDIIAWASFSPEWVVGVDL